MSSTIVTVERVLNAPIAKVWKAITDKDEMKHWYFQLDEFKAEKGFTFQFTAGESKENEFLHECVVTEVVPGKKITYSWRYPGYAGISYVTWDLTAQGNKTLLKLTHTGLDSFPKENPNFAIQNFEAGWTHIVNTSLPGYLEKNAA